MVNCFIEIRKAELKRRLTVLRIRNKYQDRICDGVKKIIMDALDEYITQSIKENRGLIGDEYIEKWNGKKKC